MHVHAMLADTLGAARKAGLHLACGHDDKALAPTDCILSNVGVQHLPTDWVCSSLHLSREASCCSSPAPPGRMDGELYLLQGI